MRWRDISSRPKCEDVADLDARAVVLERLLQTTLDRAVCCASRHVDVVDDDQPGEVAQPELPRDSPRMLPYWS